MNNITLEEFRKEYKPVPFFTNFVQSFYKGTVKKIYISILLLAFVGMFFFCTGYYASWQLLGKISFFSFSSILPLWLITTLQVILNRRRINKICSKLNITLDQFYALEKEMNSIK